MQGGGGQGGGLREGVAVPAEVALGLGRRGGDGIEGDGDIEPAALGESLVGEVAGGTQAQAGGAAQQGAERLVVAIDPVRAEGGHQLLELAQQGEVTLRGVAVGGAEVDAGPAHQAVEAGIHHPVQAGDGVVLEGAEALVVALQEVHGVRAARRSARRCSALAARSAITRARFSRNLRMVSGSLTATVAGRSL